MEKVPAHSKGLAESEDKVTNALKLLLKWSGLFCTVRIKEHECLG